MIYLLEIVSSDGHFIDAGDQAGPVTAVFEEWGFLATLIEDLSAESEEAIETFIDQLSSSDPDVLITAGENIVLFYEKSYTPPEDNETFSDSDEDLVIDPDSAPGIPKLVKYYTPYRRTD